MPSRPSLSQLNHVLRAATRLYGPRYGVVGVGIGTKYKGGRPTDVQVAVQFYVARKKSKQSLGARKLPRFVFLRDADGNVNRTIKIPTDVIAVGRVRPACGGGDVLRSLNERGALCLLFRNKDSNDMNSSYIITCAHVVGDLRSSPPIPNWVRADCAPEHNIFAKTIITALPHRRVLDFDVAVSKVEETAPLQPDCIVSTNPQVTLVRWKNRSEIRLPLSVRCALPASLITSANIRSYLGYVNVFYRIGEIKVNNAFLVDAAVRHGDSGGILYDGNSAVGIVFARSENGWSWCHLISEAINFLNLSSKIPLKPF